MGMKVARPIDQRSRDSGTVTAELAIGFSSVMVVLAAVIGLLGLGVVHVEVSSAAAAGARVLARGGSPSDVASAVAGIAGESARVAVRDSDAAPGAAQLVAVEVSRPVLLPLPGHPQVVVRATAHTVRENPSQIGVVP